MNNINIVLDINFEMCDNPEACQRFIQVFGQHPSTRSDVSGFLTRKRVNDLLGKCFTTAFKKKRRSKSSQRHALPSSDRSIVGLVLCMPCIWPNMACFANSAEPKSIPADAK